MITNYPEKASLKEVFSSSFSTTALKHLCKANGVFLLSSDKELLIKDAHLFYWGFTEINQISSSIDDEKNYKKSFRLKINCEQSATGTSSFDDFYNALTAYRNSFAGSNGITFDSYNLIIQNDVKVLVGEISYKKGKPGKVELLREVTQRFNFSVEESGDGNLIIDFIFNDRGDINVAKRMISMAIAPSDTLKESVQISLKSLSISERVGLFDRFFKYTFESWRISTIQSIKISDAQEEVSDEDEQEELEESILSGIKSALLSGTGLRSNPIVIQAVDKGYFFPKATIMFEHKRGAKKILVDFAFNSDELLLEINMVTTYEVEDGRTYKCPMMPDEQTEILHGFHDIMQNIYKEIIDERENMTPDM